MDFKFGIDWPTIIQILVSTVLPIVVGLVTNWRTSSSTRAILLALLSVVTSGLTELLTALDAGVAFALGQWLVSAVVTFVIAVATHFGLWKPTGVSEAAISVGSSDPPPASYRG